MDEPLIGITDAAQKQWSRQAVLSPSRRESYPLLTLMKINFKMPGPMDERIKPGVQREFEKEKSLTAGDLAVIEMNKKFLKSEKMNQKERSWSVGAFVVPAYSVNQTSYDDSYASNMSPAGEKDNISMNGGIQVEYKTGKRWSIQSGLYYSHVEQSSGSQNNRDYADVDYLGLNNSYFSNKVTVESGTMLMNASAGVIEIENLPLDVNVASSLETVMGSNSEALVTNSDFKQNFEYLEIPLFIRYQLVKRKINVGIMGGVSTNVLVGNDVYMQDKRIGETKDMNRVNYSSSLGVGFGYQLTGKIQLQVEPRFKYFLNSLNNNDDVTFKPYTIGVYTGVSYRF